MPRMEPYKTLAAALVAALLSACPAHAQSSGGGLSNLFGGIFSGQRSDAPAQAPAAAAPGSVPSGSIPSGSIPSGSISWSGEDGASGHPLMTADAIRQAAANFNNCVAGMWPDAARRNISREDFERFTAGLTPDLRIMDLMDAQPEFTKSIWDYLDILVNDNRLAKGKETLARYKAQFDAMEKVYGVDRNIVAAIWGIEFELLDPDRRPQRAELDCDARLHRAPPGLFQG